MLETIVENQQRTVRGNKTLIVLRLLFATISLAILLLQESMAYRNAGGLRHVLSGSGEVTALNWSADGTMMISGGSDATVRIWDPVSHAERASAFEGHGDIVRQAVPSRDGKQIAAIGDDRAMRVFQAADGKLLSSIALPEGGARWLCWSDDGKRVLVCGGEAPLRVWDLATGKPAGEAGSDSKAQVFAAFLPGDQGVVSVGNDGIVRFWDRDFKATGVVPSPMHAVYAAGLAPDRRLLAVGGSMVSVLNVETRTWAGANEAHEGHVNALAFSADGRRFITGGSDRKLMLWELTRLRDRRIFGEHQDEVLAVALAPDGSRAASGTGDKLIRVWDTQTGAELAQLAGHKAALRASYWATDLRGRKTSAPLPLYMRPEGLVVIIVCMLTILYVLALRNPQLASRLAYLQILVDVGLVSALVYHTGGVDSPFVTLYLVSVAAAAFVLSWRGAILVAACAATLFSLLTLLYGLGQIPETFMSSMSEIQLRKYRMFGLLDYLRLLLLPVCAFFLIAILAGNLAQRLAVARLLHHEVLEGIGEGILVADKDRNILYCNKELARLLCLQGELARKPVRELLGADVDVAATGALAASAGRRMEIAHRRTDGMIIPFEVRLIPVLDGDGQARGLIVVLDDITAEKKMEEFFKHKERIDAMGQISASIAHEIRNPLASIRGAVQEIARSVEIPENKKILVDIVLSESDRLDQIISDFLRYARMRPPKLSPVNIGQLLTDIRMLLIQRPEARGIEIKLDEPEEVKDFLADHEQLRQIFLNLGVNALQAMEQSPEKALHMRVRPLYLHQAQGLDPKAVAGRVDRPGISVEISDSGQGMPEDVRKQIFEPFYTTKPSGTGLGLAIVARIVQAHEGLIGVQSQPGKGTTFAIWLPADRSAQAAAQAEVPLARSLA